MSSNYDGTPAITAAISDHLLSKNVLAALVKEGGDISGIELTSSSTASDIGPGTDVVIFGDGTDTYNGSINLDLRGLSTQVIKSLNALIFSTTGDVDLTVAKSFQGAVLLGGGSDSVAASNSKKALDVSGGAGDDSVDTGSGRDIVKGGDGDDSINTGTGNDQIIGGAGNDTINSGSGNDTVYAGQGNDSINAGTGNDLIVIRNNDGTNTNHSNIVDGGAGKDVIDLSSAGTITGSDYVDSNGNHKLDANDIVTVHFENGSSVDVTHVEKFIGDFDNDGAVDTVNLVGLSDFFTS